ncbi:MAG: hypothetical protein HYR70_04225 [Chloroflexi bacterium]|nr:hypothetical protein [Chloroflexota bacterium]MBI3340763.1 hypothetical protein [Chloroflexota bacterium]
MFSRLRNLLALLLVLSLLAHAIPVSAQEGNPPVDPNGAWGEVINPNGSINYDNLTDGGVVSQPAAWMPSIPLVGPLNAEYRVYYTPSGNTIVLPTATTLFFMAANSQESGFDAAASTLGTSGLSTAEGTNVFTGIAGLGLFFGSLFGNGSEVNISLPSGQQILSGTFFQQVLSGQQNLYALGPGGLFNFLQSLSQASIEDSSLYTYLLLYTPGQCATVPGGCTPEQLALLATPVPTSTPPPSACPAPSVKPGEISAGGQDDWPPYPLVVGQDPDKNGVNLTFNASVAPTIYTYYTQEPIEECAAGPKANGSYDCYNKGVGGHKVVTGYECVQRTKTYPECIDFATGSIRLSDESRDWILNELSIRYPGAYLHRPSFSFSGSGCSWSASKKNVQVEDPGIWNISVRGRTSGTPVSAPRGFNRAGTDFKVWLKEVVIVK